MSVRKARTLLAIIPGLLALAGALPAAAQTMQQSDRIVIVAVDSDGGYRTTKNTTYAAVRDRLIKARLLERLRDFLQPVRLPRSIGLLADECQDGGSAFYNSGNRTITVCYPFVARVASVADKVVTASRVDPKRFPYPVTRDEFLWGAMGAVLLHESGHALFDVLDVPVFGREEDAADQISMLVALHLRPQLAEAAVKSFAYFWRVLPDPDAGMIKDGKVNEDFADEHGTSSQRLFNILCVAYGHSPAMFGKFVSAGWLPEARAKGCTREYEQVAAAFAKTVLPFIDSKRMAQAQAVDWLAANYGGAQPVPAVARNTPPASHDGPPGGKGAGGRGPAQ
jgi:hypothetical protein